MSTKTYTRIQLARLLGCSVSSIRRMENKVLFPRKDTQGVYVFDAEDVEDLIRKNRGLKAKAHRRETDEERLRRVQPIVLNLYAEGKTPMDAVLGLHVSCDEAMSLWTFFRRFNKANAANDATGDDADGEDMAAEFRRRFESNE